MPSEPKMPALLGREREPLVAGTSHSDGVGSGCPSSAGWCGQSAGTPPSELRIHRAGPGQRFVDATEHHRCLRMGNPPLRRAEQFQHHPIRRPRRGARFRTRRNPLHCPFARFAGWCRQPGADWLAHQRSSTPSQGPGRGSGRQLPPRFSLGRRGRSVWGSYFVPAQWAKVPAQVANFPLAMGILAAGTVLVMTTGGPTRLSPQGTAVQLSAGLLFGIGNIALLGLVARVGTGVGFTIAQLSLLVNVSVGILVFKVPKPGSRAARVAVAGIFLAGVGGVLIGNLK